MTKFTLGRDVTGRKMIEEELQESENHYRLQAERNDRRMDVLIDIIDEMDGSYGDLEDLLMGFVTMITTSLDEKRLWKKGHSERVAFYALGIAKKIGLHEDEMRDLHLAALLHDIGKLWINAELTDKPSKITEAEFESIKKHSVLGAEMLGRVKQLKGIIPLVRYHHERYDGYGYPDRIEGDEIPLGARILNLADSFDSMTSQRPYRAATGREYAFREIRRCRNTQFDPQLTAVALKVL